MLLANGREPAYEVIREAHAGGAGIRALQSPAVVAREAQRCVVLAVGGQAFEDRPDAWKDIGADALSKNAGDAVAAAARLTQNSL